MNGIYEAKTRQELLEELLESIDKLAEEVNRTREIAEKQEAWLATYGGENNE